MPELVRHGATGFLVGGTDDAVAAAHAAARLDRRVCRAEAHERFSAERMVHQYETLFTRIAT